jgi:aspartate/methionine/tyrosine aminotransferase
METLVAYGVFCEKHNLHLISDEIYAMSIFPSVETPHSKPFISVLSIDFASIGVNLQRIHVVYGMSKDFAANGLHIGVLISQHNPQLLQAVTATSIFSAVSTPAAVLWSTLLEDTHYLESFLSTSRNKLTYAYEWITQWLQHHKIKYIPSSAGHFVLISLIDWLSDDDTFNKVIGSTSDKPLDMREKEKALFYHLRKHKVGMKMGAVYHVSEPGWFRLTFTIRESVMRLALRRFEDALGWHHWAPEGSPLSHHELRLASRL